MVEIRLKKLQITSTTRLGSISMNGLGGNSSSTAVSKNSANFSEMNMDYEEILVTIRKSERGFGFELKNGILIVKVLPS